MTIHIGMWSGPRNISTAMMRSWENRSDCVVVDEPFYACYLTETGLQHPGREEILAAQSSEREVVIEQLRADLGTPYGYQKHMTHHMPQGMDMRWCADLRHCFLIRDPAEVIASYLHKMPSVSKEAIGIVRQQELFEEIESVTGQRPAVIDANDVLRDPASLLSQLCDALGVPFDESMLQWPKGRRDSDGVWAHHWYHKVEESTGFAPWLEREVDLAAGHRALAQEMQAYYARMAQYRIRP